MIRARRILHATDFSRASTAAFARALALASERGAHLFLAHVLMPASVVLEDSFFSARTWREMESARLAAAGARLDPMVQRARGIGIETTPVVLEGVAAEEIVSAARRLRVELIVIGTHGRTGMRRLLTGSVAQRVLGLASCPVLTVRGRS